MITRIQDTEQADVIGGPFDGSYAQLGCCGHLLWLGQVIANPHSISYSPEPRRNVGWRDERVRFLIEAVNIRFAFYRWMNGRWIYEPTARLDSLVDTFCLKG